MKHSLEREMALHLGQLDTLLELEMLFPQHVPKWVGVQMDSEKKLAFVTRKEGVR